MFELYSILFTILLTDIMNPVLFAFIIYSLGTSRPVVNSSLMLLGHTVSYFAAGFGVAYAIKSISDRLQNPLSIDFVISFFLGLALVYFAYKLFMTKPKKQEIKEKSLTPLKSFFLGAIVNLIGMPFAIPYFAAIDQVLKADLSFFHSVLALGIYNFAYAFPFFIVVVFYMIYGEKSKVVLGKINEKIEQVSAKLMPILLLIIGAILIVDAVMYFVYGEGLF